MKLQWYVKIRSKQTFKQMTSLDFLRYRSHCVNSPSVLLLLSLTMNRPLMRVVIVGRPGVVSATSLS